MAISADSSSKHVPAQPKRSTDRQKQQRAKRARSGEFLSYFEQLIASGYQLDKDDTVLDNIKHHLLRDLPRPKPFLISPYRPSVRASTEGATLSARSAITPNRVLEARDPDLLLAQATAGEIAILEAHLPDLLLLQGEVRAAKALARDAFRYMTQLEKAHRHLMRVYSLSEATPGRQQRIKGVGQLIVEADVAYRQAKTKAAVESLLLRRARGLPMLRTWDANKRRYKLAPGRKRHPRWWETIRQRKPASDRRGGFKVPPRWHDLDDGGLVYMHVAGAYAHGRVVPFTINLTKEVEAKARADPLPAAWLRDRIDRRIRQRLGCRVEILVGLELNKQKRLHGHGVLAPVSFSDEDEVRQALKLAGGKGYRGEQVRLGINQPDSGWASYIAKDYGARFPWIRFATTRGLRGSSQQVYNVITQLITTHVIHT